MELWLSWNNGKTLKIGTGISYTKKTILITITETSLFENVQNMSIATMYSPTEFSIERKTSKFYYDVI